MILTCTLVHQAEVNTVTHRPQTAILDTEAQRCSSSSAGAFGRCTTTEERMVLNWARSTAVAASAGFGSGARPLRHHAPTSSTGAAGAAL